MKKILMVYIAAMAAGMSLKLSAATIIWDEAQNVSSDSDVSLEGDLLYAYNENGVDTTVNGVLFKGYVSHGIFPVDAQEPDVQLANFGESRANTFCVNFAATETLSAAYENLLKGAAFNRNAGTAATFTMQGLQPGEEYLVQVWMNDNRSSSDRRTTVLDGACPVCHYPRDGRYGQWAIGRFRADSTEQTIELFSQTTPQLNSFQVRRLPSIAWGTPMITANGSDVNNAGATLYAYHFRRDGTAYYVNGVTFKDGGINGDDARGDVLLAHDGTAAHNVWSGGSHQLAQNTTFPDGTPEDYKKILGNALYVQGSGPSWLDITLLHLVPGKKYAVQFWYVDSRSINATCSLYQKIDGVRSLYAYDPANGNAGQTVTGVFVAYSTNKTIRVRGYNANVAVKSNPLINAFQVRNITADASFSLTSLADETVVRTDGELVYAYTAANENLTVNGVNFTLQTSWSDWGSGNVQFSGFTKRTPTAFRTGNTSFDKLLAGGVYAGALEINNQNPAPATLTFNGLESFKPYLIQIFVNDSRTGTEDRRVKFGDMSSFVPYAHSGVIVVRPQSSSYVLNMLYTASATGNMSPQVNAVQVRRLPDDALTWIGGTTGTWTTGASGWTSSGTMPEELWSAEEGAERDALVGDGTTLTVASGVTARNLMASGSLTLNGLPTLTGEITGGDVTIASPWAETTLFKSRDGRLTLAGNRTVLRQITVNAGVLSLATNQPCSTLRRCVIGQPGTLELAEGVVQPVETIDGNGNVGGAGTIVVDCAYAKTVGGVWKDAAILRKTGTGDLTIEATSSGTPVLEVQVGVARLSSVSESPWTLNVAAGATVDLDGKTHLISGIYGSGTIRNGTIAGTATNAGPVTVASTVNFSAGFTLVRQSGEPMVLDCDTFDLSSIAAVQIPDAEAFYGATKPVITTTGVFTGRVPPFADGLRGYKLVISQLEGGGQALNLVPKGMIISIH